MKEIVGSNIKKFRDKLGFTQESFAEFLGVSRVSLNYYENGKRDIPMDVISKSADIFGVDGYDLFEEDASTNSVNLAFAFRADNLNFEDLSEISNFKRIVKNYLQLIDLKANNG